MIRPILLVEDNPMDVELTLLAFSRRKLANPVIVARDGEEALQWIPRWEAGEPRPLAILLDVNMPKVGGMEVLQRLKVHPTLRAIPVVMLTTSDVSEDVQTAYLLGANSYIVKPVDFDRFTIVAEQFQMVLGGDEQAAGLTVSNLRRTTLQESTAKNPYSKYRASHVPTKSHWAFHWHRKYDQAGINMLYDSLCALGSPASNRS